MNKKRIVRKAHRYIGLLVSLQLLAWTLGGIWFSWNDIDDIHGDHLKVKPTKLAITKIKISPQNVLDKLSDIQIFKKLSLISMLEKPIYQVQYIDAKNEEQTVLFDGQTGALISEINKDKAILIAKSKANFDAQIATIEYITETGKHHEYRSKPTPAWSITFDYPSSPTFYVSANLGTVTAVRHTEWRIFDFLWMLHTMDYVSRDDFGNWLIKVFSIIALITAISGIALFIISRKTAHKATRQ